jgi:hypothetical protein
MQAAKFKRKVFVMAEEACEFLHPLCENKNAVSSIKVNTLLG